MQTFGYVFVYQPNKLFTPKYIRKTLHNLLPFTVESLNAATIFKSIDECMDYSLKYIQKSKYNIGCICMEIKYKLEPV